MSSKTDFIVSIADAARTVATESGLSYELMLAQAAQETGWGAKVLPGTNNIFNIKADSSWTGDTKTFQVPEYINGHWVSVDAAFRVYPTAEEALRDRVKFLQDNPRYADLFKPENLGDLQKEATILQKAGYATDPAYAAKLKAVFNGKTMQSALHSLDNASDHIDSIKQKVDSAKTTSSPIILDLNSNGVETTAVKQGAYFDHASDGFAEQTGWISATDGLLVRDINGNGRIENGSELFGNETLLANGSKAANGFEALKALDSNSDNQINADDAAFASLKIWIDANGDGFSQADELLSLEAVGITAIATTYSTSDVVDNNGNVHRQLGTYTRTDGSQAAAEDVWFAVDRAYSLATTWAAVPADIVGLPDLSGYGVVRDLQQAMILDTSGNLKALVLAYQAETNEGQRHSLVNDIIYHWTGANTVAPDSRGSYVDARQLVALEKLLGEDFYQTGWGANPGDTAGKKIATAYTELSNLMFAQLEAQTQFADLYAEVRWNWDETAQTLQIDLTAAIAILQTQLTTDSVSGLASLDGFARNLKALGWTDSSVWQSLNDGLAAIEPNVAEVLRLAQLATLTGNAEANRLDGSTADERLLGFNGDDVLNGQEGNDVLEGGAGQDTIEAGAGNDVLQGGEGNDVLDGNSGSDIYSFQLGFGDDHIHQYDSALDAVDVVRFSGLSSQEMVEVVRQGDDLSFMFTTGDRLTVDGYFETAARRIDGFDFVGGEYWDLSAIKARVDTLGTDGDDSLYGYTGGNNRIFGLNGNDDLHGNSGNDLVSGGEGNDTLYGQSGDDTLYGGAGDDVLKGSTGNDTYQVDSINDSVIETTGAGSDTVLSSVSYLLAANTENLILVANAGDLNATGNTLNNLLWGNEGSNVLNGGMGSDTLSGGEGGADTLIGGEGSDVFRLVGGISTVTDFQSKTDSVYINDSGLDIGNQNGILDNATIVSEAGPFSEINELVIVTKDISGSITTASAAIVIGSASNAYTTGYRGLFAVDNGIDTALFEFTSSAADATVDSAELMLIGTLQNTASTVLTDYAFGS
ncbi:MAG: glucosaminidase domain-containing protein [Methylovulum sp.]|nr:glucosaminidase domain-containing protein [Methylovulum sp.]